MTIKEIRVVMVLAALWVISGGMCGWALQSLFDLQWIVQCISVNLIVGMVLLLLVTHNDWGRRMFYEGPREGEESSPLIGMLWALPVVLFIVGVIWWLLAQILR